MKDTRPEKPVPVGVDPDGVPVAMKANDHWVCWEYDWRCQDDDHDEYCSRTDCDDGEWSKMPRQPDGSFAKSNDESTWVSFEDAYEAYENGSFDGIGYVFNGYLLGIDWDDVRDPEAPHQSTPTIVNEEIDALGSYTETSPSETGYHTIVEGATPDDGDGRNRDDLPCEPVKEGWDTPHVEIYDADSPRYFTVTGQHVEGTPETVEDREDAAADIYETWIAADETDDSGTSPDEIESDLSEDELITKAMAASNGDKFDDLYNGNIAGYGYGGDHSRARMAFAEMLAFWCGGNERQMLRIFEQSDLCRGDDDIRTFENYEAPKAVRRQSEFYDPSPSGSSSSSSSSGAYSPTAAEYVVEKPDGYYHFSGTDDEGREQYDDQMTTFTLDLLSRLTLPNADNELELEVDPANGEAYTVTVPENVFNEPSRFKDHVAHKASTAVLCNGTGVAKLGLVVAGMDAPRRKGADAVGIYGGKELVTPDGSLTPDGWADSPEYVFCGEEGSASSAVSISPEDGDDYDEEAVREILRLLPQTRSTERFVPMLGWYYLAPLRPVMNKINGEFNGLNILGNSGAGKSSAVDMMNELFGIGNSGYRLADSRKSYKYSVSQTRLPVVFDEYKPSDVSSNKVDAFKEVYRSVSRSNPMNIATVTNTGVTNRDVTPKCAIGISGEQPMSGAAEERRSIATTLVTHAEDSEEADAYARLTGEDLAETEYPGYDLSEHALAYYQWALDLEFEEIEPKWHECNSFVVDVLSDVGASLEPTERRGMTTVALGATLYQSFATDMGLADDEIPLTRDDVRDTIEYLVDESGDDGYTSHVEELCELVGNAADAGYLTEGDHYKIVNGGKESEYVAIARGNHAFAKVKKFVRDHDVECDIFDSFDDYAARIRDEVPEECSYTDDDVLVYESSTNAGIGKRTFAVNPNAVWPESTAEDADDIVDASLMERLEASETGRVDLNEVTILEASEVSTGSSVTYFGELSADGQIVDFMVTTREFDPTPKVTYRLENAKLETNEDGNIMVKITTATEAKEMTEPADDSQSGLSAATDGGHTTGESEPKRDEENAIVEVLNDVYDGQPVNLGQLCQRVADRKNIAPDRTRKLLDDMENRPEPRVMDLGGGKYEPI